MKASVVIRAKNEEKWLGKVLKSLENQTEKDFETILIDDNSTDKTLEIFEKSKLNIKKVIPIEKGSFTHARSINLGMSAAKSENVFFLVGHSIPVFKEFIEAGLGQLNDPDVAGVFGPCTALSNATTIERLFYSTSSKLFYKEKREKFPRPGTLGFTNAAVKKSLWEIYPFNEKHFKKGGEDTHWAGYFMKRGYVIVFEPKMESLHSHSYNVIEFVQQAFRWITTYIKGLLLNLVDEKRDLKKREKVIE